MAYTTADLDALQRALVSGEHLIMFDNKRVQFRSVDEIKTAIREVQSALIASDPLATGHRKTRQIRLTTSKGF